MESARNQRTVCCACEPDSTHHWIVGYVDTPAGKIPRIKTKFSRRDRYGSWRVRWGIGRGKYAVQPGLYAVGSPSPESTVFVTANYKMSFDELRSRLEGRNAWILILDTKGINVWCSAGKGTFGTDEIIRRIEAVHLGEIVSHRKLVLPQLSATGVSAHVVYERCGWRVIYGPIRAEDIPEFIDSGMKAAPWMRRVRFSLTDRLVLIPVELVGSSRYLLIAAVCFVLLSGFGKGGYSLNRIQAEGLRSVIMLFTAYLAGAAFAPALLPWIPGRAFSAKGACIGLAAVLVLIVKGLPGPGLFTDWIEAGGWLLLVPAASSFLAMNFTGASTYTSLSGVRREMRVAVPAQIAAAAAGVVVWVVGKVI